MATLSAQDKTALKGIHQRSKKAHGGKSLGLKAEMATLKRNKAGAPKGKPPMAKPVGRGGTQAQPGTQAIQRFVGRGGTAARPAPSGGIGRPATGRPGRKPPAGRPQPNKGIVNPAAKPMGMPTPMKGIASGFAKPQGNGAGAPTPNKAMASGRPVPQARGSMGAIAAQPINRAMDSGPRPATKPVQPKKGY